MGRTLQTYYLWKQKSWSTSWVNHKQLNNLLRIRISTLVWTSKPKWNTPEKKNLMNELLHATYKNKVLQISLRMTATNLDPNCIEVIIKLDSKLQQVISQSNQAISCHNMPHYMQPNSSPKNTPCIHRHLSSIMRYDSINYKVLGAFQHLV